MSRQKTLALIDKLLQAAEARMKCGAGTLAGDYYVGQVEAIKDVIEILKEEE